jgi:hypothetical protein
MQITIKNTHLEKHVAESDGNVTKFVKKTVRDLLPVVDEILEEELVRVDKVERRFGADEAEQPLLVAVPRQRIVHFHLKAVFCLL